MMDSSTSTAPNKEISCAVSRRPPSSSGHSRLSLDLLIRYIDNVLSAINNQGFGFKVIERGTELRDLVQPVASDFSQLFEGISEGAKIFSDQNFFKSRLSTEAHSMAVDVLKGLGNAHWVAVGLLAIANVLERFDNISANDRECIDLLKAMLKLGKYLKQMKDLNVKMHKEVLDDMCEAVQLIVSGAILCRSFITSNKLSKFFLTKKIRDELVYIRGKVNAMKADLMGHMQLLIMRTLTFIHEQYITGRNDENYCLGVTEQYQSNDIECEMEQSSKTELDGSDSNTVSSQGQDNCNDINGHQQLELPLRTSLGLGKFFRKKIRTILRWRPKDFSYLEHQMLLKDIQSSQIEFKRKELIKATKGFKKKIGEGAVGIVYQGNLSDGRQVAVKVVSNISSQSKREWMNELSTLTKLQHRNIVELVGYCFEDDLMLVYDYMPRNLERIILGKDEMIIDWPTRHSIILDIIRGLKHLHDGCIVHRDIKPSNILLDQNLNAKISDFGIARILQPGNAKMEISTDGVSLEDIINFSSETTHITGTVGYLDPEYLQTYCVTLRSDIYSFGVLMLNVVSGKKTVFHTNGEMHYLPPEAWRLHEEDRLTELIDPRLINTEGLINSSSIIRTVKIALWCIKEESKMRPSASRVLKMLSSVEEIPSPTPDQSFYENYSKDKISSCISSSGKSSIAESSVADDLSSDQEVSILTSPVGGHFLEEMILSPTLPLELSSADYNLSQEENWIPPFPPILSSADYNFLREENWIATPPIKSSVADDHYSEEKIPTSIPPVESLVIEDHSSEEEIHIASPPVGSVVTYGDSFVKKIEESDRKWSGASLITLRMLCVFSLVSFICISRMFTILSPLYSSFQ